MPGYRAAHFRLAGLLLRTGHREEANREIELALQKDDMHRPRYLYQAGLLYARNGNRLLAEDYLKQANAQAKQYGLDDLKAHVERRRRPLD